MQAFLAILRYDASQLARSWLVRIWVAALVAPAVLLVVVAFTNETEVASEVLAFYMRFVLVLLSVFAVSFIAVAAVSGESDVIADSILSRSVTRTEYISAKIVARLGATLGVYFGVMVPVSYLVIRGATPDTSPGGVAVGLLMVASLLAFLVALGVTLSTLLGNVLLAGLLALIVIIFPGLALQFLGPTWMSTTAVIYELDQTFRGETPIRDEVRVLSVFMSLTVAAIFSSLWLFRHKDL